MTRRPRSVQRPRALRRGGTIGICSPSGPIEANVLESGVAWLRSEDFEVVCAPHVLSRRGYLAGTDAERRDDFLALLRDPAIDAILCSRGGFGSTRWLGTLDPLEVRAARKLVIGFSDVTAIHLYLYRCAGLTSIHGPMIRVDNEPTARARMLSLACGEAPSLDVMRGEPLRGGSVTGPLIGGNLILVANSLGTPWEIDTRGAILFVEEVSEQPYAIDRLITQLEIAGKLAPLAGVAIGQLVDCESERYPERGSRDVIRERFSEAFAGPIVLGLPFGHVRDNLAVPCGVQARLDGDAGTLTPLEAPVEVAGKPEVETPGTGTTRGRKQR